MINSTEIPPWGCEVERRIWDQAARHAGRGTWWYAKNWATNWAIFELAAERYIKDAMTKARAERYAMADLTQANKEA
jgi:hypothetical protein